MIYFVSGHRNLTQEEFDNFYAPKIDNIVNGDNCASFVVGDWEGLDSMFIDYMSKFEDWEYGFITIYCVDKPRVDYQKLHNNVCIHCCSNYDECDASMTKNSDFDIAWIRPGRGDSHTALNIKRRFGL